MGVPTYRFLVPLEQGTWHFKVAHADGSVAWGEIADMPEDFDRLAGPQRIVQGLM